MTCFQLTTPVAFFIYKRPEATWESFSQIAKAKPKELFIVADGAQHLSEEIAVEETRKILKEIDWDCHVHTNMSDVNMGCKQRFVTGLKWIFSHCEEAIIIEDDIVVSPGFFKYAQELLEYYRDDKRVYSISGCNIGYENKTQKNSYSFSNFMNMWGWATWRRAYNNIDFEMEGWSSFKLSSEFKRSIKNDRENLWLKNWIIKFDRAYEGKVDTWDYQWIYSQLRHNGVSVVPATNMVANIGYGEVATHTANSEHLDRANLTSKDINFPLRHPCKIKIDRKYEDFIIRNWCDINIPTLYERAEKEFTKYLNNWILKPAGRILGKLGIRSG
ncbi:hypothetical protein N9934_02185 [Desulfosarcina sp.]|nr:hypothetical protein [Desulfosarcina sp.]